MQQLHVMLSLNKPEYKPLVVREKALVSQKNHELKKQAIVSRDTHRLHLTKHQDTQVQLV